MPPHTKDTLAHCRSIWPSHGRSIWTSSGLLLSGKDEMLGPRHRLNFKGIGRSSCPNLFRGICVMKEVDPYLRYKIMIHTVLFGSNPFRINFIHHSKPSERVRTGGTSNGFKEFAQIRDSFAICASSRFAQVRNALSWAKQRITEMTNFSSFV